MATEHVINVLGMDPSFSNWGFAFGRYNVQTKRLAMLKLDLALTQKTKVKNSRVSTDDLQRAKVLSDAVLHNAQHAHVIFVEVPTGSQSARAMASYGVCVGILAALRSSQHPFIEVGPLAVKLAMTNNKQASKEAVIQSAMTEFPKINWPKAASKREHCADAIGAIKAGMLTDDFAQLIALRSGVLGKP